jgi:putative ABC transport system substrate-binding protein
MTRREFITLLGGAAAWPITAWAQQATMSVIGFIDPTSPDAAPHRLVGFRQGLKRLAMSKARTSRSYIASPRIKSND